MRLIDADELLLKLELASDEADAKYHETDFDSFYGGCCSMIQEAIKEVEKQPTAYDVDKVVEQLEERSILSRPVGWSKFYKIITLKDAIEIVKLERSSNG